MTSGQGDHVDELGHDRESDTARADRVDEIAAEAQPGGQGAGGGAYGAGTAGEHEGLGGGSPGRTGEGSIGGGTGGERLGDGGSDRPGAASDASTGGGGRHTDDTGSESLPE